MNKVFLNGYLAQDPKSRITPKGLDQSNITVAVDDLKNSDDTFFIPCVVWGNSAKFVNANLKKGSFVAIDGRLSKRKYVNKNGENAYITEVIVDNIRSYNFKKNNIDNSSTNNEIESDQNNKETLIEIDNIINAHNIDNNVSNENDVFNEKEWDEIFEKYKEEGK